MAGRGDMTPLKKDQKADIVRRLDFIRVQVSDLGRFATLTLETYAGDRDLQRNVERLAENVANAAIDIAKVVLVGESIEMPNSYREIVLRLGDLGILHRKLAEKMAEYAALRNVLAHQYLDLRWGKIRDFLDTAGATIPDFIAAIHRKLEED
jgi:uncharacterized protein YutE (UPF0331/DUF86 family)